MFFFCLFVFFFFGVCVCHGTFTQLRFFHPKASTVSEKYNIEPKKEKKSKVKNR